MTEPWRRNGRYYQRQSQGMTTAWCSLSLLLLLLLDGLRPADAFIVSSPSPETSSTLSRRRAVENEIMYNDFDLTVAEDSLSSWHHELQRRLEQLNSWRSTNWQSGDCTTSIGVALPDHWVRRVAVANFPVAACGSASDDLFVVNLSTGRILARSSETKDGSDLDWTATARVLYSHDGGGTVAVACWGRQIFAAPRRGGVALYRHSGAPTLLSQGSISALEGQLVTSLHVHANHLWVGTAQGIVQAYALNNDDDDEFALDGTLVHPPLSLRSGPDYTWSVAPGSVITSITSDARVVAKSSSGRRKQHAPVAVVTTSLGSAVILSMQKDGILASVSPPFDAAVRRASHTHALCATLVHFDDESNRASSGRLGLVVGASDGTLFVQPLRAKTDDDDDVLLLDTDQPWAGPMRTIRPRHAGAVTCLTSPAPGLVVSGATDGSLRVWSLQQPTTENARLLYQFMGYKVWLGSLWTDGRRLVSDGADNTVIVHDFGQDSGPDPLP
jgi:WD40 repeat protein